MRINKIVTSATIFLFIFFIFSVSLTNLYSQSKDEDKEISEMYKKAEGFYENGNFNKAIEIYEKIINNLNKKKELARTKQKLFKTMVSLSLTLFTIQQAERAKAQLDKLITLNPNQTLDKEIYPPDFINIFEEVQKKNLGSLTIKSTPDGAEIMIDNKSYGKSPLTLKRFLKGKYTITASLKGYNTYSNKIDIMENKANLFEIKLVKRKKSIEKKGLVEKKSVKTKKKKSPILFIAGGAVIAGILILLLSKKSSKKTILSKTFTQNVSSSITPIIPSYSVIIASGISGKITRVEYNVVIEHPRIEDLSISIISTDNRTAFNIWNKGPHQDNGKTFNGSTEVFNSVTPNGNWKVAITNSGSRLKGNIVKWQLKIFYTEK